MIFGIIEQLILGILIFTSILLFSLELFKRYKIVSCLLEAGFVRIGLSSKYIHCDNDDQKPPCIWLIN